MSKKDHEQQGGTLGLLLMMCVFLKSDFPLGGRGVVEGLSGVNLAVFRARGYWEHQHVRVGLIKG